ncbi:hypothetical protein BH11PSE11_BH11PSE11_10150 [soil metagenome]
MKFPLRPLILVLALAAATQASAVGRVVDLNVYDRDSGQQLKVYNYRGQNYVVGTPGNRYAVSIRNLRGERFMTVISVDGVNVVSGETAAPEQTGYVLDAHASTEINGWRKNMNEIAAFVFANEASSYAAQTGRPDNVGVIGVAVFREKPQYQPYREGRIAPAPPMAQRDSNAGLSKSDGAARSAESKSAAPAAAGAAPEMQADRYEQPRLGTAHGQRESSQVDYTDFRRASSRPEEVVTIRYDSYRNLVAQGVIPRLRPVGRPDPRAFPGQFVPDPN